MVIFKPQTTARDTRVAINNESGLLGQKIQYPPDMRRSGRRVSIEVPQREGDGRQALVTSPFYPAPAASLKSLRAPFTKPGFIFRREVFWRAILQQ